MTAARPLRPAEVRRRPGLLSHADRRIDGAKLAECSVAGRSLDGLTQPELAVLCGLTPQHQYLVSHWENHQAYPHWLHIRLARRNGAVNWAKEVVRALIGSDQLTPAPTVRSESEQERTARVVRELLDVVRVRTECVAGLSKTERELVETREAQRVLSEHEAFLCAALEKARAER